MIWLSPRLYANYESKFLTSLSDVAIQVDNIERVNRWQYLDPQTATCI